MCADAGADEKPGGLRILDGEWCDAYLGRWPVRRGYCYVIWKGRHVTEPTQLSSEESIGFWREVTSVASAIERRYRPAKMNWLSLGNWVPHLHVHLVPRHADDPCAGGPLEQDAFDQEDRAPLNDNVLRAEAKALKDLIVFSHRW